ncbi:hypothetical protein [Nostoc sp.]|uniref:hypothetical protein n=1 Tax=Nostoc sp. TaxID=1180 RepID=UPI002FF4A227
MLETVSPVDASNQYAGFTRNAFDIKYLQITGTFYAIDDVQFDAKFPEKVPEPASTLAILAFGALGTNSVIRLKQQQKATTKV